MSGRIPVVAPAFAPALAWALAGALVLAGPLVSSAAAQESPRAFDIVPTFQGSVATAWSQVAQARFSAFGVMAGYVYTGSWSPHVWVQRYRIESDCQTGGAPDPGCRVEGWTVSVGPALRFLDTPRWEGNLVGQVGLDSRYRTDVMGGAGVHVGVRFGPFVPVAFSRIDYFRGAGYATFGVGLRFRLSRDPTFGDPRWGG